MADVVHLFNAGGWMMYPLVLCSVIVIAIAIERFRFYSAHTSDFRKLDREIPEFLSRGDMEGLKAELKKDSGIPARVILHAAEQYGTSASQTALVESAASHEAAQLRNYLNYLSVIVTLSPLMGLLGTVIGMIGSFNVLSVSSGQPFAVTAGVAEALICTATGLFVAIIAMIVHTYFSQRLDHVVSQIEQLSGTYLAIVEGGKK